MPFQAKYRSDKSLTGSDLGTFHIACDNIIFKHPNSKGYLYYTSKLQADVKEYYELKNHIIPIKFQYKNHYKSHKSEYIVQELYSEQKKFLKILNKPWTGIGLMCLPCGYGKLVIGCHFAKKFKKVIVISPLRVDTKQAFERIKPYVPDHTQLLFDSDSDGTTDISDLENTFAATSYCICTTEKSAIDVFTKYQYEKDVLILVDEIHEYNESHKMWNFLQNINATILGMTATRTEILANITTELIYMPLCDAIEQKKVCDYEIYLPIIEDNDEFETFIPSELSAYTNIDILSKVIFLVTGMHNYGFRHCILYLSTIEECTQYKKMIEKVFEDYYGDECIVGIVTADCSTKERNDAMEMFRTEIKYTFLCSVRILDQNIDIPICDSVFITNISRSTSEVRTIQRMCRANRKVKSCPNKIAGCFLWTNSDDDLCHMLNMVKNEDPGFYNKIKRISANYTITKTIRTTKEKSHTKQTQSLVQLKCISWKERIQQKFDILIKYFETNTEQPSCSKTAEYNIQSGFNLGHFWNQFDWRAK